MMIRDLLQMARDKEDWDLVEIVIQNLDETDSDTHIIDHETPRPREPSPLASNEEIPIIEPKKAGRQGKKKGRLPDGDFIAPSQGQVKDGQRDKTIARREPMNIPREGQRKNRFTDNQRIHAEELVTKHPELGVPNPMPRGKRGLLDDLDIPNTGQKVEIQCSLCEQWFKISPALAHGYDTNPDDNVWKCNDCNTRSGREYRRKRMRDR